MTRRERVKAAIHHQKPDKTPVFIHLAPDAWEPYGDALWERYGREDMRKLRDEGKIEYRNALYYSMGSHVCLLENFPWWWWKDLPAEYGAEEAPDFIPDTVDMRDYEQFAASANILAKRTILFLTARVPSGKDQKSVVLQQKICGWLIKNSSVTMRASGLHQ